MQKEIEIIGGPCWNLGQINLVLLPETLFWSCRCNANEDGEDTDETSNTFHRSAILKRALIL